MNPKAMIQIAVALSKWAKETGIKFTFGITTNGSLVRPALIDELSKIGLKSIRITLDGDKAHHDKRRPFLDGRGSFDTIINNISAVINRVNPVIGDDNELYTASVPNGLKVEISGNFDRDNMESIYYLLDYLDEHGLSKKIRNVIFAPVIARLGESKNPPTPPLLRGDKGGIEGNFIMPIPVEMVGCHSLSGELGEAAVKLRREVIQRGYKVDKSAVVTACPMGQDHSMVVIDPYGDIYKCAGFVGRPEFSVGNVRADRFNYRHTEFMTMNLWKQCPDCIYVPMCGGGCRLMAQLKHSDCTKISCDIEYYQKLLPELVKMDYEGGLL